MLEVPGWETEVGGVRWDLAPGTLKQCSQVSEGEGRSWDCLLVTAGAGASFGVGETWVFCREGKEEAPGAGWVECV